MINDPNQDELDGFFKEHFESLPKFEQSESRDKILLNTILARAEEIRKAELASSKQSKFSYKFAEFIRNFSIFTPQFAIPIATLLILSLVFFLININEQSNKQIQNPQNKEIAKQSIPTVQNEIAVNNVEPKIEEKVVDFGSISYDFASRSVGSEQENADSLNKEVMKLISNYFKNKKIKYEISGNSIEADWLLDKNTLFKLKATINKKSKEIQFDYKSKKSIDVKEIQSISPERIKIELQDELMKNLHQFE